MTTPYKILIIEDEPDDVELILLGFSKHDEFFVDVATTGEEGLERVATNHYDLVSVDFALPGISGLDVLEEIRKSDQDVPVVMVTGRGTEELQVVAFEKFATSYVMKSVDSFRSLPTVFEALINESRYRSQERRMKREIERSETVSRYILENSPMGIYVLQNGSFKMANSKFAEIFGCDKEKLIGEPFWSLAEPASFECEDEEAEEPRRPPGRGRSQKAHRPRVRGDQEGRVEALGRGEDRPPGRPRGAVCPGKRGGRHRSEEGGEGPHDAEQEARHPPQPHPKGDRLSR
jgi:PAS domain S-box-containing protein